MCCFTLSTLTTTHSGLHPRPLFRINSKQKKAGMWNKAADFLSVATAQWTGSQLYAYIGNPQEPNLLFGDKARQCWGVSRAHSCVQSYYQGAGTLPTHQPRLFPFSNRCSFHRPEQDVQIKLSYSAWQWRGKEVQKENSFLQAKV